MANQYLVDCKTCGGTTSRKYARTHDGECKTCFEHLQAIERTPRPQWGTQEWAETRGDDLGLSPDF